MNYYVYVFMYAMTNKSQIVEDLQLPCKEEIDDFFTTRISETVRDFQLEHDDTSSYSVSDKSHMEKYAQEVLLWTADKSRTEILQRVKYQEKKKQFMFVFSELPVDPTVAAMFTKAADPQKKNPLCFKGTARLFLSAKAMIQTPPISKVYR